jgi:uncharacterized membrane protein
MSNLGSTSTTSTGLASNVAGALAYLFGPITGIVFFLLETEDRFVRFHAAQSITLGILLVVASVGLSILGAVLAFIPMMGWLIWMLTTVVLSIGTFVLWLLLIYRAYRGELWEVPFAGQVARRLVSE